MPKKLSTLFPLFFLLLSLTACNSRPNINMPQDNASADTEPASSSHSASHPEHTKGEPSPDTDMAGETLEEPVLSADATDEELLDALGDNIHRITEDDFFDTVSELIEHTDDYSGKIYQMEGIFTKDGEEPYISRTFSEDGHTSSIRLPLKYLPQEPEENTPIRVTGIINKGQADGEAGTVLEVHVLELLEGAE